MECSFECVLCGAVFPERSGLQNHIESEHEAPWVKRRTQCPICDRVCFSEAFLALHMRRTHDHVEDQPCPVCSKTYCSEKSLRKHMLRVHAAHSGGFKCPLCSKEFLKLRGLRVHLSKTQYKCRRPHEASYESPTQDLKEGHNQAHESLKKFSCSLGAKAVPSLQSLQRHMKAFHEDKAVPGKSGGTKKQPRSNDVYKCHECARFFVSQHKLDTHLEETHAEKCVCPICEGELAPGESLMEHVNKVHGNEEPTEDSGVSDFKTPRDDYATKKKILGAFPNKVDIKSGSSIEVCDHEDVNESSDESTKNSSQSLTCHLCRKKYKYKWRLLRHLRDCPGYDFSCSICFRGFPHKQALSLHKTRTHGRIGCSTCGQVFLQPQALSMHKRKAHNEYEQYKCRFCMKTFTAKKRLVSHISLFHLAAENWSSRCPFCTRTFAEKASLIKHIVDSETLRDGQSKKDEAQIFTCDYCSKEFTKKGVLKDHILNMHSDQ